MKRILSFALLAAGCSTSVNGGAPAGSSAADSAAAIVGPQFVTCTTDTNGTACQFTAPAGYPLTLSPSFSVLSATGTQAADLGDGAVHTINVGSNAKLLVMTKIASGIAGTLTSDTNFIQQTVAASGVQTFSVPFDIWPIHLRGNGAMLGINPTPATIPIAPWQTFFDSADAKIIPSLPPKNATTDIDAAVIVAHSTASIAGNATFCTGQFDCQASSYTITAPGTYYVSESGLSLTAPGPTSNPDMAGAVTSTTDMTVAPDMTQPASTCGNNGQVTCVDASNNQFCNAGTVMQSNGTCATCGDNGEPACRDASNNSVCNAGTVLDSSGNCDSCGAVGEVACSD